MKILLFDLWLCKWLVSVRIGGLPRIKKWCFFGLVLGFLETSSLVWGFLARVKNDNFWSALGISRNLLTGIGNKKRVVITYYHHRCPSSGDDRSYIITNNFHRQRDRRWYIWGMKQRQWALCSSTTQRTHGAYYTRRLDPVFPLIYSRYVLPFPSLLDVHEIWRVYIQQW